MIVVKGVEIIAKRDKVTYATNVTGKWVDYSIETELGKRVKETFELVKTSPTKDDPKLLQKAADNLRVMLTSEFIPVDAVTPLVNLFDSTEEQQDVLDDKFVVTAGINSKTGRQLFICTYEDSDEYSITVVPTVMSKQRAHKMIGYVTENIKERAKKSKLKIEPKIPEFEVLPASELPILLKKGQV